MEIYPNSFSQEDQESFVLNILKEKKNGFYLEIGSWHPVLKNNTYLLETEFNWTGLALDINQEMCKKYTEIRKNKCLNQNAILFDYEKYFLENKFPNQIDYLQIDIDQSDNNDDFANVKALINLPLSKYRFSVITIEHNLFNDYMKFKPVRDLQRSILNMYGYKLIYVDLVEDWWIDPFAFNNNEDYNKFLGIFPMEKEKLGFVRQMHEQYIID